MFALHVQMHGQPRLKPCNFSPVGLNRSTLGRWSVFLRGFDIVLLYVPYNYAKPRSMLLTLSLYYDIHYESNALSALQTRKCTVPINKKFPFRLRKTHRLRLNTPKKTQNERIELYKTLPF